MYSCAVLIMLESNTRPDFKEKQLRVWQFCGKPLESELAFFFLAGLGKTKSAHFRCIKFVSDFISETTLGWFFRSLKLPTFSWKKRSNQTMGPSSGRSNFLGLISSYHTRSYIRHGQAKTWRVRVLYDSAISNPGNDQCLCWFFLKFLYIFYSAFIT